MKKWGGPPSPRGSPRTRSSSAKSASSKPSKPTRASAADQGVRPTRNASPRLLLRERSDNRHHEPAALIRLHRHDDQSNEQSQLHQTGDQQPKAPHA